MASASKPKKPHKDYPLFAHQSGQWAKKVKGRMHYFGKWADHRGALEKWLAEKDDLLAGRTPRTAAKIGTTLAESLDRFLSTRMARVNGGELSIVTYNSYLRTTDMMAARLGKHRRLADLREVDFEKLRAFMSGEWCASRVTVEIGRVRTIVNYFNGSVDMTRGVPISMGPDFKKPSQKSLRLHKQSRGDRLFSRDEIQTLLAHANATQKAMILLGVNCGFGNTDCAQLPLSAVDLKTGWIDYPRAKTAIERRCKLWPETVDALQNALRVRPTPRLPAHAGLFFINRVGKSWQDPKRLNCPVMHSFWVLLQKTDIEKIDGRGFYALRHVFQTEGGGTPIGKAFHIVRAIMGHVASTHDMGAVYEKVRDDEIEIVTDHVRHWLYNGSPAALRTA